VFFKEVNLIKLVDIFTFENIYNAHERCRKAKQHKREVIEFEVNLGVNISKLIKEIGSKTYKLGKYRQFKIYDPKERIIEALPYRDRVIIDCFCINSLAPRIEPRLIYDNVACRKNKGTLFGIKRLNHFLRKEYHKGNNNEFYYLKCDIKKYFPSINHDTLLNNLRKAGFSKEEMWLMEKLVRNENSNDTKGLPLGNQSSQWFALFYLDKIDRLIKEKLQIKGYVRYMDDFILIHRDKSYLQYCLSEIQKTCKAELDVELNHKTQIGKVANGIDFLGFRIILKENGKIIKKLRSTARVRLKKHLKTLKKLEQKEIVDEKYIKQRKNSFYAHIKDSKESKVLKDKLKN